MTEERIELVIHRWAILILAVLLILVVWLLDIRNGSMQEQHTQLRRRVAELEYRLDKP